MHLEHKTTTAELRGATIILGLIFAWTDVCVVAPPILFLLYYRNTNMLRPVAFLFILSTWVLERRDNSQEYKRRARWRCFVIFRHISTPPQKMQQIRRFGIQTNLLLYWPVGQQAASGDRVQGPRPLLRILQCEVKKVWRCEEQYERGIALQANTAAGG